MMNELSRRIAVGTTILFLTCLPSADSQTRTECPKVVVDRSSKRFYRVSDLRCFNTTQEAKKAGYNKSSDRNLDAATLELTISTSFTPTGCPPVFPSRSSYTISQDKDFITATSSNGSPFSGFIDSRSTTVTLSRAVPFTCFGGSVVDNAIEQISFSRNSIDPKGNVAVTQTIGATCSTTLTCSYYNSGSGLLTFPVK